MEEITYHSTVEASGKRRWLYPLLRKGAFYKYRSIVSYVLLVFLFAAPFIKFKGHQFMMFNILERKFILFGQVFWPQDFFIFVLAMLLVLISIVLFTIAFGRVFCGWICPQTIFLEMVFRKIEVWIEGEPLARKKLDESDWNQDKIIKKTAKHFLFLLISFLISNTFLAYIIGSDSLFSIITEPIQLHWVGFIAICVFTLAFYLVFSQLRELVCIVACPYGRLQGVMLDKNSLVVAYNYLRGEPRGKLKKGDAASKLGDCVDCNLCVAVCPTGIDIRKGTQLECVNCTACIDACDDVMDKIHKPRKLIGFYSEEMIANNHQPRFNLRMKAYSFVLVAMIAILTYFLMSRKDIDVTLLRAGGMLYQEQPNGYISNLYNAELTNKTVYPMNIEIIPEDKNQKITWIQSAPKIEKESTVKVTFFVLLLNKSIHQRKTDVVLLIKQNGKIINKMKTSFLGPVN
ncbi:cytochrome c oxidase accessory protein CcoG [Pedobacter psychrophilus]|uniref:Cytochrome c oxidase accessory protein CcoG n=1 Tax=Pedobacter psychrophilus TaxID=1826909 RepID=A0A179DE45_9SPHI|nr:cytochrome c oxidase accessory protein CcoG [Pedobacter psychrophilus]OAQ39325.1 cytochrome c oxidase accessory protein CcoG [Pedobacter psychrophilus]